MKNIITLLLFFILFILVNSHDSNDFVKSKRIFNLKNKNDKIAIKRKLQSIEDDSSEDDSESSSEESIVSEESEESYNQTEPIGPATGNENAAINCLGISNYNYNISDKKINFKIIFSFIKIKVVRYIIFTLLVSDSRLRNLKESKEKTICTIENENDIGSQNINVKYNCVASNTAIDQISLIKSVNDFEIGNNLENVSPVEGEINFSQNAAKEIQNIQNQNQIINYSVTLNDGVLKDSSNKRFTIKGIIDDNYDKIKNDDKLTLTLYPDGSDRKDINCTIINKEKKNYQIRCIPSEKLNANLYLTSGITDKNNQIVLNMTKDNRVINTENLPSNKMMYKKSGSGLSGGGIAGIVIACVVALVIASIIAIMLKKSNPQIQNSSSVIQANSADNLNG